MSIWIAGLVLLVVFELIVLHGAYMCVIDVFLDEDIDPLCGQPNKKCTKSLLAKLGLALTYLFYAVSIGTLLAILVLALTGHIREPESQHRDRALFASVGNASGLPDHEVVFQGGKTLQRTAWVAGVEEHKAKGVTTLFVKVGHRLDRDGKILYLAWLDPHPFVAIESATIQVAPGGFGFIPNGEAVGAGQVNVLLGKVDEEGRPRLTDSRNPEESHAWKPLRRELGAQYFQLGTCDLQGLFGDLGHFARGERHEDRCHRYRGLSYQHDRFHCNKLITADGAEAVRGVRECEDKSAKPLKTASASTWSLSPGLLSGCAGKG